MTFRPTRSFSADVGQDSTGAGGPDAIEQDFDSINRMFDPNAFHAPDVPGGIGTGNMQPNAVTDLIVGPRNIDENISTPYATSGLLTQIVSWFAKLIKTITGEDHFWSAPADSIKGLAAKLISTNTDIDTVASTVVSNKADIEGKLSNLAGAGRTVETVIDNKRQIDTVKISVNGITTDIGTINQRLSSASTELTDMANSIQALTTQMDNLNAVYASDAELAQKISDLKAALESADDSIITLINGKAPLTHKHVKADINDFGHTHFAAEVTTNSAKQFVSQAQIDLFNSKASGVHTHTGADISNWADKANRIHTHFIEEITNFSINDYYTKTDLQSLIVTHAGWKEEVFTATVNQTNFALLEGDYAVGKNRLAVFINGLRLNKTEFDELDSRHFGLAPMSGGEEVIAYYCTEISVEGYVRGNTGVFVGTTAPQNHLVQLNDIWIQV